MSDIGTGAGQPAAGGGARRSRGRPCAGRTPAHRRRRRLRVGWRRALHLRRRGKAELLIVVETRGTGCLGVSGLGLGNGLGLLLQETHLDGVVAVLLDGLHLSDDDRRKVDDGDCNRVAFITEHLGHPGLHTEDSPLTLQQGDGLSRGPLSGLSLLFHLYSQMVLPVRGSGPNCLFTNPPSQHHREAAKI